MGWVTRKSWEDLVNRVAALEAKQARDKESLSMGQRLYAFYHPKYPEEYVDPARTTVTVSDAIRKILDHLNLDFQHIDGTPAKNVLVKKTRGKQ